MSREQCSIEICENLQNASLIIRGAQWLQHMETVYLVFLIICTLIFIAIISLSVVHLIVVYRRIKEEAIQNDLYFLILLLPIVGGTSLIGLYLPRTADFMFIISLTYLMMCLHKLLNLMRHLYGSRKAIAEYIQSRGMKLKMNVPPLCCCCRCLPQLEPNEKNLRSIEWIVFQSPIIRIIIQFIMVVIYVEHEKLREHKFSVIFRIVNLTQVGFTLQKLIFDLIGSYAFESGPILSNKSKAMYWNGVALIFEMFIMSIVATICVNPERSALFDANIAPKQTDRLHISPIKDQRL
ncbi:unnamed protein product [Dracunculus medinensis]|uniref:Organic solute transporter alpha-like protein n=1 Tax=Dracunculus medinensis TaxID=318479 RepID=A0A0N4UHS3_DRAME|nr:unnamed protein product [Dracunculus medinensis]